MTTLASQMDDDLSVFFDTDDLAESATLNGGSVSVVPGDSEKVDVGEHAKEFVWVDVEFKASDYPTITQKTDTLVLWSLTWKYPQLVSQNSRTKIVRFRNSERPNLARR